MVHPAGFGRTRAAVAAATSAALALALAVVAAPAAQATSIIEDFEDGPGTFTGYSNIGDYTASVVDGQYCVEVPESTGDPWDIAAQLPSVEFEAGTLYVVTFDARASREVSITVQAGADWPDVFGGGASIGTSTETFSFSATPEWSTGAGTVNFQLGGQGDPYTICFDNVSVQGETELLDQTSFADGLGDWNLSGATVSDTTVDDGVCIDVPGETTNPWDVNLHYDGIAVDADENYALRLTASADPARTVRAIVGEAGGAYRTVTDNNPQLTADLQDFEYAFTAQHSFPADGDAPGQVAIQIGGHDAFTFCITEVSLVRTATPPPPYEPDTGPRVRVNQVGYVVDGPKTATLVTEADAPVAWTLRDGSTVVAEGTSVPRGTDPTADLAVHTIDFSSVTTAGDDFTLEADGETSLAFEIGSGEPYQQLLVDALSFFYPQRSGEEILGSVAGAEYARPAGHVDVAPNQGDSAVTCLPSGASVSGGQDLIDWYDGYTCDYTLDVTGGWYDAGDHGKYVVNGGISVAQLLGVHERTLHAPSGDAGGAADGTLRVPESDNDVPDVLDEARVELEWMLRMQVPEGETYEGMVHHKVHDAAWTGIPLYPHNSPQPRYLHRPSTAATLNLAAVAAQGARLFADHDESFAAELLDAAEVAYAAALETPDLYAPNTNTHPNPGGGPYDDGEVEDEFYWAAAELYLTTGDQAYLDDLQVNAYHLGGDKDAFQLHGFDWKDVASLARINLATVPSDLPDRAEVRDSVLEAADALVELQADQPFGQPYVGVDGGFEWGSNGKVLNNLAVLGAAFDVSEDAVYRDAVLEGMDYILGRNALNISYVTGYGEVYAQNQHSRWYAAQVNSAYPHPPVGTVSGGPNSDIPDPVSGPLLAGCAPQLCYVDDIGAWGVNELTINWNSALASVASYLADMVSWEAPPAGAPFPDVPLDHPFVEEIRWLQETGISIGHGDGNFYPLRSVTRQAMAAFLYRAAGSPAHTPPATSPFSDVPTTHPLYTEISWMADAEVSRGYTDGSYRPTRAVSRGEMSAFVYRALGSPEFEPPATPSFSDVGSGHTFFTEIEWMAQTGVTLGYTDGTYRPSRSVLRQAMAAFLYRADELR